MSSFKYEIQKNKSPKCYVLNFYSVLNDKTKGNVNLFEESKFTNFPETIVTLQFAIGLITLKFPQDYKSNATMF